MGLMHITPPALAWPLAARRTARFQESEHKRRQPLASEGVGSYWPFATGKRVVQANLLLEQIINCTQTRYVLIPNQHDRSSRSAFAAGVDSEGISQPPRAST